MHVFKVGAAKMLVIFEKTIPEIKQCPYVDFSLQELALTREVETPPSSATTTNPALFAVYCTYTTRPLSSNWRVPIIVCC